jgi:hypothetical protein
MMNRSRLLKTFCAAAAVFSLAACGSDTTAPEDNGTPETPGTPAPPPPPPAKTENDLYMDAARTAWSFVANNTQSATGLAQAHYTFQYVTTWDIASQIAATYSAHELGIINDADYDARLRKILSTLQTLPLFEGSAFNRFYDSKTGKMVARDYTPSTTGFGWSTTDIGRLLTWLRIINSKQPQYSSLVTAIVNRINYSKVIAGGTLQGVDLENGVRNQYGETGLGYEQYAAAGFALWGKRASNSLDATSNAQTVTVLGAPVTVDRRGLARATSEPYILMGLETGWYNSALADQAKRLLAAQQARYDQQGVITMVTEDAMPDPPYYFYYYSVYHSGKAFVVEGPANGSVVTTPRWISTKAAFAWRALVPTDYTLKAFNAVQPAAISGQGWGAGVYESNLQPTGDASLNTAGVVLESALYKIRGSGSFISEPIS